MTDESANSIIRRSSTTYFLSSLFFPRHIRLKVFTLYAFVRTADNFVDVIPQDAKGFYAFKSKYEAAAKGKKSGTVIIDNYVALSEEHNFSPIWTRAFLKAMELDLYKKEYRTLSEVCSYMYGSAEVIGLMLASIFGLSPSSYWYARRLGRAMQYINMLRDIAEDLQLGRQYIPTEILKQYDVTLKKKMSAEQAQAFALMVKQEIRRYVIWNAQALKGLLFIPLAERLPVATAATMYQWTAETIFKSPMVVWQRKIKPSSWRVFLTAAKFWIAPYESTHQGLAASHSSRD